MSIEIQLKKKKKSLENISLNFTIFISFFLNTYKKNLFLKNIKKKLFREDTPTSENILIKLFPKVWKYFDQTFASRRLGKVWVIIPPLYP